MEIGNWSYLRTIVVYIIAWFSAWTEKLCGKLKRIGSFHQRNSGEEEEPCAESDWQTLGIINFVVFLGDKRVELGVFSVWLGVKKLDGPEKGHTPKWAQIGPLSKSLFLFLPHILHVQEQKFVRFDTSQCSHTTSSYHHVQSCKRRDRYVVFKGLVVNLWEG